MNKDSFEADIKHKERTQGFPSSSVFTTSAEMAGKAQGSTLKAQGSGARLMETLAKKQNLRTCVKSGG